MIVKPLAAALRDKDPIRAIVRGTGSNQDGQTPGITLPNPGAQEALIKEVYATAHLDVLDTDYVEAHGTGTPTGDPLEIQAIAKAFQLARRSLPLYVGSVKANLGHLEGGAGIVALIKVILMLEAKKIPGLANFKKLNPRIQDQSNIVFPTHPTSWPRRDRPSRASINSFGFGGTNSHVVVEEFVNSVDGNRGANLQQENIWIEGRVHTQEAMEVASLSIRGGPNTKTKEHPSPGSAIPGLGLRPKNAKGISEALLFILTAADQSSLIQNTQALKEHIHSVLQSGDTHEKSRYIFDLAYTLNQKRSSLR